ncbi:electron transfer flavoprotein-ubiquinone oxidoreductase [Engelhardtia mirabilis]|uniref:Electron transfer flavoprotein-ubiquinone oxidoreductase n=1 Tax=Engelhardtia mirabilis TaxID=2528011 RepID=A0A518BLV5_9BACT|nr:Electron transfer flavoprotein-ubiquinone oxidoreductase [Planctomycetes bacterium Pla133]QDV02270.1 Electron transfer flavoprotein-ubiquinone oxidoreductase [Planctomycetes bacterium Pla86]
MSTAGSSTTAANGAHLSPLTGLPGADRTARIGRVGGVNLNASGVEREEFEVDVLFVGAGAASLASAITLQRLAQAKGQELSILILEKAEDIGYHTLSGAVMDPRAMQELFPDFLEQGCPVESEVTFDCVDVLFAGGGKFRLKGALVPPQFKNHGNYIVSLYKVVRWLKDQAEELGIDIYAGFAASEVLYDGDRVVGVQTRDSGLAKDGSQKGNFEPGMNVKARATVFAEGTRGSLTKGLISKLGLDAGKNPQIWETGIKEIWSIPEERGKQMLGSVIHTALHPLGTRGYGGGWIYGQKDNKLSIGFVVGLDHPDAKLDPHALFVQWKQHPALAELLEGGKIERYGAKTIPGGGYYSLPRTYGDGFMLIGDCAGFVNMARLKGIHLAMKSGMLAAEALIDALAADDTSAGKLKRYEELVEGSWIKAELWGVRNFRQAFAEGFFAGSIDAGLQMITGGRGLKARRGVHPDYQYTERIDKSLLTKPTFDDGLSLDKLTDVYHSGAVHEEDQPSHLVITDPDICVTRCTEEFGNPCQNFCPAAVYEWTERSAKDGVMINASNCVHCKTCDVADPYQVIEWTVPEGGGGPKYIDM